MYIYVCLFVIYKGWKSLRRGGIVRHFFFTKNIIYLGNYDIFYESDKVYELFPEENIITLLQCKGFRFLIKN